MEFINFIKDYSYSIGKKYTSFFELKHLNRIDLLLESF